MTSLSNANAEVYVETSTNVYSYKGSVTFGNSINTTIDTYDPVWVLVTPTTSNAYVYITAYASAYSSTSSTSLSDGAVAAIVICIFCCWCCCILIIGIIIGFSLVKKNQNLQRNQSAAQYIDNRAPPPTVINNYQYQVPPPSYMQPSYIQNTSVAYPTPGVYTGQPIAMNANPQPALAPGHLVPSNPVYISKEVGVPVNKI